MRSRKANHNVNPAQKTSPLVSQIKSTESALPNQQTIGKSADSNSNTISSGNAQSNRGRHAAHCRICKHARRQDIEDDFVAWESPAKIARDFGLADRSSVYRHAHAMNIFPKRRRNARVALERIIERGCDVEPSASALVAAVQALAKINARGEWIERDEDLTLHNLFERMTPEELDAYAEHKILPSWFQDEIAAAGGQVPKVDDNE